MRSWGAARERRKRSSRKDSCVGGDGERYGSEHVLQMVDVDGERGVEERGVRVGMVEVVQRGEVAGGEVFVEAEERQHLHQVADLRVTVIV